MIETVHFSIQCIEILAVGKDMNFSFPSFPILSSTPTIPHYTTLSHLNISTLLSNVSTSNPSSYETYSIGLHE
jgi:hypothetical protein